VNAASGSKNLHGCISPTSGNLSLILNLLTDLCLELSRISTCEASKILLLQWSGQLLETCKPCTSQLNQSELFQRFLSSVVGFCESTSAHHPFAVELLLSSLLDLPDITLKVNTSSPKFMTGFLLILLSTPDGIGFRNSYDLYPSTAQ
jgi:hypothetical protein